MSAIPQKIALIQMTMSAKPAENLRQATRLLAAAAKNGATVACLPELFLTPYFCQREDAANFDLAEPIPGATTQELCRLARSLNLVVVASLFERRARGVYHNTAAVIDADGALCGVYRKSHIPDDPNFYEKFYFTPGDTGFRSFATRAGKIGVIICWDQWFPESARLTALTGADIIFAPTAIGRLPTENGPRQHAAWETVQRGHAVANGVYYAACNRAGFERTADGDGIEFWGQSFIADPMGEVLALAPVAGEAIIYAEMRPRVIEDTRRTWPFFRDRRPELYAGLPRVWNDA
ncbi:apolipoprotein acyltransferase [Planctomycetales bacterium]|nr:apolipoprotein acyltransferase [Planctomycetales bacterium]GHT00878.1 apolipoprotein acyltransferase [Planctomycetales bacterium]GHT04680.1 apolipoprotein acyltransferase [Planctomycetales bacterium]